MSGYFQPDLFSGFYTQRWRKRKDSFVHNGREKINPAEYEVVCIKRPIEKGQKKSPPNPLYQEAKSLIIEHHYSGSVPPNNYIFILLRFNRMVGVAAMTIPSSPHVLLNVFPDLTLYTESVELGRFILLSEIPFNAESWFWARVKELLASMGVKGILAHSDPMKYVDQDGTIISPGHIGYIYQATGALYLDMTDKDKILLLPTGRSLHPRMLSKIRNQEQGCEYAIRQLLDAGARMPGQHEDWRSWVNLALQDARVTRIEHPGKHRYAWLLGKSWEIEALKKRLPPCKSYPKPASYYEWLDIGQQ